VSREEQLQTAWYEAHQELRKYLEPWTYLETARSIASVACALWVRKALDGWVSHTGPYGLLYEGAYETAKLSEAGMNVPDLAVAERTIPTHGTLLPYQLSKIYVDCWKAGQLLHWDRKTANRATRALSMIWPTTASSWAPLPPDKINPLAAPLARRAVETLNHHECLDCAICSEAAVRWESADRATEEWFTGRRLKKEEEACPTEERSPSQ
jgi:hypothetical protein